MEPHNQIYGINSHRSMEGGQAQQSENLQMIITNPNEKKTSISIKAALLQHYPFSSSPHFSNSTLQIHSTSRMTFIPSQNLFAPTATTLSPLHE